jgi:NADPH:quinone reductase-like Zn-dependent oxidoreductase
VVYEDAPRPDPGEDEVLVRVHAAGVNPADWQVIRWDMPGRQYPWIPGYDVSGVVEAVGPKASGPRPGAAVYGMLPLERGGAFAEYAVARECHLCARPASVGHAEAAALPVAALTAWQALFDAAHLCAGQRVLIHAAAGGVGHLAVQLAKWREAYVIGTGSAGSADFLHSIGVDRVVDYASVRFEEAVRGVDVVLDPFGGETATRSIPTLRQGGVLVSLKETGISNVVPAGIRAEYVLCSPDGSQLAEIAELVDGGRLVPSIDKVYPLSKTRRALELSKEGHTRGKIVVDASRVQGGYDMPD